MKYVSFPKRELGQKNYDMSVALSDKHPFYSTVKNWVARFRRGHNQKNFSWMG
jgi:hypothetical protein